MWHSNTDYSKYPTYAVALALATASGRGAEFSEHCTNFGADSSDTSRELCREWDFWRKKYPEVAAFQPKSTRSAQAKLVFSTTAGIADVACKSVVWADGLVIATHYGLAEAYRSRNGFPIDSLQSIDVAFWSWAAHYPQITRESCVRIWNAPPVLEWVDFRTECIVGSDITPEMFELNVERITNSNTFDPDTGEMGYEVLAALNIEPTRFFEGEGDSWNRPGSKFGGEIYAFTSDRTGFFNAKPRIPVLDKETGKFRKYEARRKNEGEEGNKIFYPNVSQSACDLLSENFGLGPIAPHNYWAVVLANPAIPVGIAEGAKKAVSLTGHGFPCVAVLGVANWSVGGSQPRILLPDLAALAVGARRIDIWYDMDDPIEKVKAFKNGKIQAWKLTGALKEAGASDRTRPMCWDLKIGKGVDDAIQTIRSKGESVRDWIFDTINYSRHREIYLQTSKAYDLDPSRQIERDTVGDYLPDGIVVRDGAISTLIADTGSGKTHQIDKIIQQCKINGTLAIIFTPTNKLGEQAAHNFGIPHRNEVGSDGQQQDMGDILSEARQRGGLVICPDSLDWARYLVKYHPNYMVICDEADKIAEHLSTGGTIKDRYAKINSGFAALLQNARSIVVAEAKISEGTLAAFEKLSHKPAIVYRHRRETAKRQARIFVGLPEVIAAKLLLEICDRLERGENVIIPTDSQRMADKIERYLQARFPALRGMRNDAHTSYLPDVKILTKTPNTFLAENQLRYLIFSPVCKAGWDLKGFDIDLNGLRSDYHFDVVCGFFGVLPTSDAIQMVARYRPNVPLFISIPEVIMQRGDELFQTRKALKASREEELLLNIYDCQVSLDRDVSPIQEVLNELYENNTIRNGMEKSIARFSLQHRLLDDGHDVQLVPISMPELRETDIDRYEQLSEIIQILRELSDRIDRDWSDLIAGTNLRLEDDLKEAARLDRLEAPTPEQRAKAAKIRLVHRFPGVDFDPATTYHTTRKYGRLASGRDLLAKLRYQSLIESQQREKNGELLKEDLLAIHHLGKDSQRVKLLLGTGIVDLLSGEYCNESPELVPMKAFCLEYAPSFAKLLGVNINAGQTAIHIYCKLLAKLGLQTLSSRPGTGKNRPRYYRVLSTTDIGNRIVTTDQKIPKLQRSYDTEQSSLSVLEAEHLKRIELLAKAEAKADALSAEQIAQGHSWSDGRLTKLKTKIERLYQEYLKSEATLLRVSKEQAKLESQLKIDQNPQVLANSIRTEKTIFGIEAKLAESKSGILRLEAKLADIKKTQAILSQRANRQQILIDSSARLERKTALIESIERRLQQAQRKLPQLSQQYEAVEVGELLYAAALRRLEAASNPTVNQDSSPVAPVQDVPAVLPINPDPIQIDIWGETG